MSESTVAIVGSGIAGTTIAYQLTQSGYDVEVFEKGPEFPYPHSRQYHEQIVNLYHSPDFELPGDIKNAIVSGDYRGNLDDERAMVVGGSATHWGGVTPRMIPEDFRTKSLFGYGDDWPITYEELEPYYCRAEAHIGVSGTDTDNPFAPRRSEPYPLPPFDLSYGDRIIAERLGQHGLALHTTPQARTRHPHDGRPGCANFGVCHVCPIGVRYSPNHHLQRAISTGRCTVHTNVSVRRIFVDGSDRARALLYQSNEDGALKEHAAQIIIVAAGAIESARLLLLSASDRYPDGLGNQGGQVGQNLTFHHIWSAGLRFKEALYPGRIGPATGRSLQFVNPSSRGQHGGINLGFDDGIDVRYLESSFNLWDVASGAEVVERMGRMAYVRGLNFHAESTPSSRKYIALAQERDRFGDPFAQVHYHSSEFDYATHTYARSLYEQVLIATGAEEGGFGEDPNAFNSGAHHMGTCRMGQNAGDSVVDSFGKVHGLDNVFVAGSSTFVGGSGAMHPTLTLTALAIRSSDYLLERLRST